METQKKNSRVSYRTMRDYAILTVAMAIGAVGLNLFLLPNEITMGGIVGIASIVYWGTGVPVQDTYFVVNAVLLIVAVICLVLILA